MICGQQSNGEQEEADFRTIVKISSMETSPTNRRRREPRVPDNPMAVLARAVLNQAVKAADTADALTALMEPHLRKRYGGSAIYQYTNERAVPPGDVLLAAAAATGISLDEKLGIGSDRTELRRQMDDLRLEMARMREEMGELRTASAADAPSPAESARAGRRDWAQRSTPAPETGQTPASRGAGRSRRA
jgi:hypothetical protein